MVLPATRQLKLIISSFQSPVPCHHLCKGNGNPDCQSADYHFVLTNLMLHVLFMNF